MLCVNLLSWKKPVGRTTGKYKGCSRHEGVCTEEAILATPKIKFSSSPQICVGYLIGRRNYSPLLRAGRQHTEDIAHFHRIVENTHWDSIIYLQIMDYVCDWKWHHEQGQQNLGQGITDDNTSVNLSLVTRFINAQQLLFSFNCNVAKYMSPKKNPVLVKHMRIS